LSSTNWYIIDFPFCSCTHYVLPASLAWSEDRHYTLSAYTFLFLWPILAKGRKPEGPDLTVRYRGVYDFRGRLSSMNLRRRHSTIFNIPLQSERGEKKFCSSAGDAGLELSPAAAFGCPAFIRGFFPTTARRSFRPRPLNRVDGEVFACVFP